MAVVTAFKTLANTDDAGLTAYFRATDCTALTIADVIPLFSKITAYEEEYVIGEMKIWDTGEESSEPNNCAMVRVMVYNDGWIVAWFDEETISQQNTSPAYFIDEQTLDVTTGISYSNCYNGMLVEITSSSPTDPECPNGTIFCIRKVNYTEQTITVHEDLSPTAYHFNIGHEYDLTIRQSNGNLVWWENQVGSATTPTNLSNRLYRTIYEMWENLRYSSNATDVIDTTITKAFLDDGGSFTDYTTEFNNTGTNDCPLMPTSESIDDAFYFGHINKFNGLKLDIDTAGVGNTIAWEYWNGSTWSSLTVTDLTSGFTVLTNHIHIVDDTSNPITSTNATNQTTLNTLLNEIKTDYNLHRVSTTYHDAADNTNAITSDNATDLNTSITLANEIKTDYNAHRSQSGVHPYDDDGNTVTAADGTDLDTTIVLANEIKGDYNNHLVATQDANTVIFIPQDDWAECFVNSSEQYWIRSRVSVAAFTTQPLLTQGWVIIPNSLEYSNSNLGMYSFEDTSANYCLICGKRNIATSGSHGDVTTNSYFYNTPLLGKTIFSHTISYGFRGTGGGVYGWNSYIWMEINGKQIYYKSGGIEVNYYTHGYIILNIESIDTEVGLQNVYKIKNRSTAGYNANGNSVGYIASILITN